MTERRGASLGTRIFLGTAFVVALVLVAAIVLTTVFGERIAESEARGRLEATASLRVALQQQRYQQLGLLAEIMAGKPEFRAYLLAALEAGDSFSILDQLEERSFELGYDLAIVTDADGRLAARTDQPDAEAEDLSSRPLIARVSTQFEAAGIWSESGRLYEAVAVPMAVNDGLFGFLALGYEISDLRALEVKRSTGSEAIFLAGAEGTAVASSLTPPETARAVAAIRARPGLLVRVVGRGAEEPPVELRLDGERWLAQVSPLSDAGDSAVGAVVSLASLDRALAGFAELRNVLLIVGAGALVVALLLSYLLARRVSKPIGALVRATQAAREGRFDVERPSGGSGEVNELADSFHDLMAELRERREVARYVDKLARNLPEPAAPASAPAVGVAPAVTREAALVAVELRGLGRPRTGQDSARLLGRLDERVTRLATAVGAQGGEIVTVCGDRVVAVFGGSDRCGRALAALADSVRLDALSEAEEAPSAALAVGAVATSSIRWGEGGGPAVLGLPLDEAEALLREAGPGEIALSTGARELLDETFADAGIDLPGRRGLLSPRTFHLLDAATTTKVAEVSGRMLTHVTTAGTEAAAQTLAGIGPGSLLGQRFEILQVLGSGGMGVVYKARDRDLDDIVALKMLKSEFAGDQALVERLKSELKLARRITHPNVLRTFDFGEIDGHPFISMEYVRGLTLRSMLEPDERMATSAAVWLARQLLAGLAAAHAIDILHRDIKPENVLLDPAGNLRLMDFGLARPVERLEPGQTQEGWLVGTPHYLAPEQIRGEEADRRADVYACGVVLYELFTGELPFEGGTSIEILNRHLNEPPAPPSTYWPEIPPALESLLLDCLAKDRADRPADAGDLLERLGRIFG